MKLLPTKLLPIKFKYSLVCWLVECFRLEGTKSANQLNVTFKSKVLVSYKQLLKGLTSIFMIKDKILEFLYNYNLLQHFKQCNITKTKLISAYNCIILPTMSTFYSLCFKKIYFAWHEMAWETFSLQNWKLTWNNTVTTTYRNMFHLKVIYIYT